MTPKIDPGELRSIRSLDDLVVFLADDLDWPMVAEDLEAATYEYTPEELGISPERMPTLERLRQLRPLTVEQPWGIFFLEFSGPRLPITPLRRLLQSLVTKKRVGAGGDRRTWDLDDLLFFITTDSGQTVELHLVAFFDNGEASLEIRSLPWRPAQSPDLHLNRLATELLPSLAWPDDPDDLDRWRTGWRDAFKLRHGAVIKSASHLAERMAETATNLRTQIGEALGLESGGGPFCDLMEEVKRQLVADVDANGFADMCAQTLVYGILSSRVTDPVGFGASPTLSVVPLSNPFLAAFFEQVHDQAVDLDLEGSGLDQLVADLRATNVEAILDQFGSTAKGGDPVIHFYEEFLTRYDREMRADAGAFYTPQPVVEFMVRAVDEVLRTRFGLELGLADASSWATVAERNDFEVPAGVDPGSPFVSMIDPATGTGTFLVEWLRRARQSFEHHGGEGEWIDHLREHVLPSIHAFELMLGPYSIAHLKVALELHNEGIGGAEVGILLTDTLDHSPTELMLDTMRDAVAVEGEIAASLKDDERFTVVVGNPPYDREQRSEDNGSKRKGGVVRYGVPGINPLLSDVIKPMTEAGLGVHVKNIYNDYVYFWRWATWQATQKPDGPGVVAFITASSYLTGISMGGLRSHLRGVFDELWIFDLGGDSRGALVEENVFDIRTPVAIAIGVRTRKSRTGADCTIHYLRVTGDRETKFAKLSEIGLSSSVECANLGDGLAPFVPTTDTRYYLWPVLTDLIPWIHSGSQVKRTWPIGETAAVLDRRWERLVSSDGTARAELFKETRDRTLTSNPKRLLQGGSGRNPPIGQASSEEIAENIEHYGYRSFDRQMLIADSRVADFPRPDLWAVRGERQVFLTTLTSTKLGRGPVVTATPYVPDLDHFRGSFGAKNVMPFYLDGEGREPNLTGGLLDLLEQTIGADVSAADLLQYVHGLLGTPAFSEMFSTELGEAAGPVHVPITTDVDLFSRVVSLGRDLLWWHCWGERFQPESHSELPSGTAREIRPVADYPETYGYEPDDEVVTVGSGRFGPVPQEVWDFEVSGLKVVSSWLGYRMKVRKGRKSSPLDEIRPEHWTFSDELLKVLAILEHTLEVTPQAAELLAEVVAGPVLLASDVPMPSSAERKPPR